MMNAASYLASDYEKQYREMEPFARWNLPEEIGLEWIDATEIIHSDALSGRVSEEAKAILISIRNHFEDAFKDSSKAALWTADAMKSSSFWEEQRSLAKQFLNVVS